MMCKSIKTKKTFLALTSVTIGISILSGCSLRPEVTPQKPSTKNGMEAAKDNINLGLDYLQTRDTPNAKTKLMTAIKEEPNYAPSWYAMAYYEEVTDHLQKAEADYKHAIALAPQEGQTHNNYGTFLCRHKRYNESITEFVKAAETQSYVHTAGAYENAGLCALMIPDSEAAKGFFLQALENGPARPTALYELARIYYKEGKIGLSENYYDQFKHLETEKQKSVPTFSVAMKKPEILHR